MDTVEQGRIGEAAIVAEFVKQGYGVYLPQFGNAICDMIVCKDGIVQRVECKSTAASQNPSSWTVELRQIRSNKTQNNIKKFNADNSDLLAVYLVMEDRVVIFDSKDLHGRTGLNIKRKVQPIGDGN